jgi:glutathione S-transferase
MRRLYHLPLSPFSRKVRIVLAEKGLETTLIPEKVWERRPEFLALNPAGQVPVLIDQDGTVVVDSQAIAEYLEVLYPDRRLLGFDPPARAEQRRLTAWFDLLFHNEVTVNLLYEKVNKRFMGLGEPDSARVRAGHQNIHRHLTYVAWLAERRKWLAGDEFGLADIAAAAQLSCLDYINAVPWDAHEGARDWYARVKSRPAFRAILADHIAGMPPPRHYADLDF